MLSTLGIILGVAIIYKIASWSDALKRQEAAEKAAREAAEQARIARGEPVRFILVRGFQHENPEWRKWIQKAYPDDPQYKQHWPPGEKAIY